MAESTYAGRIRTRGCAVVIKDDKILLVQQQVPTRKTPVWLPPGGEVKLGETAKDAAAREAFEETGIKIEPSRLIAVHEFIEPPFHAVELYFLSKLTGGTLLTGVDPELQADDQQILKCEFIDLERLSGMSIFPPFVREINYDWLSTESVVQHFMSSK
ncbi:NUDIX domain-containing protein [Rhodohalobacter sp. 8-1]|uniref:NUDIX domain-containing protein n=1 Tax=Rhodohalobacter sp. 8-1 TaxID=3131972 RepID=UPI0030EB34EE